MSRYNLTNLQQPKRRKAHSPMAETNRSKELERSITSAMRRERWLDAIKLLKNEVDVVQEEWRLSWNLGWCYFKLDRLHAARKHLIRATTLAANNPTCKWALGNVYLRRKQFGKAETVLAESLRIKESHLTRIALALAYLSQGKVTEAENVHLEGIRLRPKKSTGYESYAAFLSDIGREADSQRMTRKSKKLQRVM
jgi:Flp pilus assembly protein TadD